MSPGPLHGRGNEKADEFATSTASRSASREEVSDEYRWETSLSHMTRASTGAKSRTMAEWITDHVSAGR